uniref:Uncharacterized protein n=1 Tax=Anopheles farauti TaxID=69004 RepID=A0A182Q8T5_9DIPT
MSPSTYEPSSSTLPLSVSGLKLATRLPTSSSGSPNRSGPRWDRSMISLPSPILLSTASSYRITLATEHGFLRSYFVEKGILEGSPNWPVCTDFVEDVEDVLWKCRCFLPTRQQMQHNSRSCRLNLTNLGDRTEKLKLTSSGSVSLNSHSSPVQEMKLWQVLSVSNSSRNCHS